MDMVAKNAGVSHHCSRAAFLTFWLSGRSNLVVLLLFLLPVGGVLAEGSWQLGLFEGVSHDQPLVETDVSSGSSVLYVDIQSSGELINIHVCGESDTDSVTVEIFDDFGNSVYAPAARTALDQNFSCTSDFDTTFDPSVTDPFVFEAPASGSYEIHLNNDKGNANEDLLNRFDVTVTNSVGDSVDPRANGGRLWSKYWKFNAGAFTEDASTDADLYVVSDGGFSNSFNIWQLDLNNFAGFAYSLKANNLGVDSPNAAGDVVAGISVGSSGNSVSALYPMYVAYPAKTFSESSETLTIENFRFTDSAGIDSAISPQAVGGTQEHGTFRFTINATSTAVYEIIIDIDDGSEGGPDGVFGQGDYVLRGAAVFGENLVDWDGKDNNGDLVALGNYAAAISVRVGEFHFVAEDVETSGGAGNVGLSIKQAQSAYSSAPAINYWDNYTVLGDTSADAFNISGIYDTDQNWGSFNSSSFGNGAFVDTYAFASTATVDPISVGVVDSDEARPSISKSFYPESVFVGDSFTMSLEITNNGSVELTNLNFTDDLPEGMELAESPSPVTVIGTGCTAYTTSAATSLGGSQYEITDGTLPANGICTIEIELKVNFPGTYRSTTSGVGSTEAGVGTGSNTASLTAVPGASGPSFQCDGTFYVEAGSATSTGLYRVDRSGATYSLQEFTGSGYSQTTGYGYNALGYSPADDYLYAMVTESTTGKSLTGSVLRIESSGAITDLGVPEVGPILASMPSTNTRFHGGAVDESGLYYVVTDSGGTAATEDRSQILTIDVSISPPQVLSRASHGLDIQDIAIDQDGTVYAYTTASGLVTIDPDSGSVNTIGGTPVGEAGSLFFDSRNELYVQVDDGTFYRVDLSTGAASVVATGTSLSLHDGASCNYGMDFELSVTTAYVEIGGTTTYVFSLVNQSDTAQTFDLEDSLGDGRSYVAESLQNTLGGTANSYANTSNLSLSGLVLPANTTDEIRIDVSIPSDYPLGLAENQAVLNNLPTRMGSSLASDQPETAAFADPTTNTVIGIPAIGAAKAAVVSDRVVSFDFVLENPGASDLDGITLTDDLDDVFGANNYTVSAAPVFIVDPGTLTLDADFTGNGTQTHLLDTTASNTLAVNASARIRIEVSVTALADQGDGLGFYTNQAISAGDSPAGTRVADLSNDGLVPDTDGDGDPTEDTASGGDSDENVPSQFTITFTDALTGTVFIDNGGGGATPYDSIPGGGESGLGEVVVQAIDPLDNDAILSSSITTPDGRYVLDVEPSAPVMIRVLSPEGYLLISENPGDSGASNSTVTDGELTFTPAPSTDYDGLNFGLVKVPSIGTDQVASTTPGSSVVVSHVFRAESSGDVSFELTELDSKPDYAGWTRTLHRDVDCDGQLGNADSLLSSSIAMSADSVSVICVLVKITVPSNAPLHALASQVLVATMVFSDPAATGHGLTTSRQVTGSVRVGGVASGKLVLSKMVVNVTQGEVQSTVGGSALPGDVLRYVIRFENSGTGPITDLRINDGIPAFSLLYSTIDCPGVLPASLSACTLAQPSPVENLYGYAGTIQWTFNGTLSPGASGEVQYDTVVE